MKKIIIMLALLLSSLNADLYVAAGFGTGSGTLTGELIPDNGGSVTPITAQDFDATLVDFKVGVIFESNNRLEFSSTTIERDTSGTTVDIEGLDLDYIWTIGAKDSIVIPFITAGLGLQELITGDDKITGMTLNAGLGVYFVVAKAIEIELSYSKKSIDYSATHVNSGDSFESDYDDEITLSYLGVKFKF